MENSKKRKTISTDTPFETPDTRPRDSLAPSTSKVSPIRAGRLEEKAELQELNQRLERYIFRQREKEAAQGTLQKEINFLKQNYEGQIKTLTDQATEERRIHNERRTELLTEKSKLEQELGRSTSLLEQLQKQLVKDQKTAEKNKALFDKLSRELQAERAQLLASKEEVRKLGSELDLERETLERLKTDLDRESKRADEASEIGTKAASKAQTLQEDLDNEISKYIKVEELYRKEKEKNARGRQIVEDELRKEFGNQLQILLGELQAQYEKEKDVGRENLRDYYEIKLKEKTEQLETAQRRADELSSQLREEKAKSSSIEREIQLRDSLNKTISDFEAKLQQEQKRYKDEVKEKERIINIFRERTQQKDEDFNALMDVKIALAMEIKAYRLLLENEEDRLGITFPGKPDKKDSTASLVIAAMEIDGSGFKIRNGSTEEIPLKGWTLRSRETGAEFAFPAITLPAGDCVTLYTGSDATSKVKSKNELAWPEDNIWETNGDSVQLVNKDGQVVHDAAV